MVSNNANTFGIRRLLQLAQAEWITLFWGFVFLTIGSAMLLLYPQFIKRMIDESLQSGELSALRKTAGVMLSIFMVQAGAGALRYYLFTTAGERIVTQLRDKVYLAILRQEIAFFDGRRTGELMSRLAADSTVLQNAVSVNISMLMRNLGAAVGGLILLIYTSPSLAFALFAVIPPLAAGTAGFGRKVRKISRQVQDAIADTASIAEETISGIRTVRAFAREDWEAERYRHALTKALTTSRKRIRLISLFTGSATFLGYLGIVAIIYYGGSLVIDKQMSIGDLTSFILYTLTVAVSVGMLGSLWTDFNAATGAGHRIFEILDRQPALTGGHTRLNPIQGDIQFDAVSFSYPSRPDIPVLRELTLRISPGEIIALVGPSGSGKSTIAALITRFYEPITGTISLDQQDLRDLDPDWLRRQIGIVSQDPVLMSTSIYANICYGSSDASQAEVLQVARDAHADQFISGFTQGYDTVVGERGVQLSGGQRQRIAIARAMLKNPKILILDEATSALDAESEHLVQDALQRLMRGRTSLVIAHRLSTVRNAHRILVIDGGRIVQEGTHHTLIRNTGGVYYKLVHLQTIAAT